MSAQTLSKGSYQVSPILKDFAARTFKFFASVKLAIVILLGLMVILATGTIIESRFGADAAKILVYQSAWFNAVLTLLGINVAAAALSRIPWKKKHIGFVVTHVGILLILTGAFVSQQVMIDGQIVLAEGETDRFITLQEPVFYVFSEDMERNWKIPFKPKPFSWSGEEVLGKGRVAPVKITLLDFYPKSILEESLEASEEGASAIQITIENSFVKETRWLVEGHPIMSESQVGPAKMIFAPELLKENKITVSEAGYLEFQLGKKIVQLPLDMKARLPVTYDLDGTPYKVTVRRIFKNALVIDNELVEQPVASAGGKKKNEWRNPAVQLLLEGEGISERHTVFSNFPEFQSVHGMKPSKTGGKVLYRMPGSGSRGETHELRFVRQGDKLFYQIKEGLEIKTGELVVGQEINTGWMNLIFRADKIYPHAIVRRSFRALNNLSRKDEAISAVRVRVEKGGDTREIWLAQGMREKIEIKGISYYLLYGQKRVPLGFRLSLEDFRVESQPGTNQPASFESDVIYKDVSRGISKKVTISMNKPLEHRGFKIYQSGYSQPPGEPEISVFAVARDPGIFLKYTGAIVMVLGTTIMFSLRRFAPQGVSKT